MQLNIIFDNIDVAQAAGQDTTNYIDKANKLTEINAKEEEIAPC